MADSDTRAVALGAGVIGVEVGIGIEVGIEVDVATEVGVSVEAAGADATGSFA